MSNILEPSAIKVPQHPRETGLVGSWMGDFKVVHRLSMKSYLVECKYCKAVFKTSEGYIQKNKTRKCLCKQGTVRFTPVVREQPAPQKPSPTAPPVFEPGARFGRLVVVEQSKEKIVGLNGYPWLCRCDCGTEKYFSPGTLTSPSGCRSCGCLQRENTNQVEPGETYGKLTVLSKSQVGWLCRCECGNEIIAVAAELVSGRRKSCGCLRKKKELKIQPGETFGKLTVIEKKEAGYLCQCECGNETMVYASHLLRGRKKSCGCLLRGPRSHRRKKVNSV